MKTIDNWKYLGTKLDFSDKSKFYMVQLQQRKKDDETFPANNRTVKTFFIGSLEEYNALEQEIKKLSDETGSRVYIRLNRRSFEEVALEANHQLAQILQDKNFQHLKNLIPSAAGIVCSETKQNRLWIIDIDDMYYYHPIMEYLESLKVNPYQYTVETLHGVHIVTHKFDSLAFKQAFPNIDIHKNNPTLLYFKHE